MTDFKQLVQKSPRGYSTDRILGIDPGETTGLTVFQGDQILWSQQVETKHVGRGGALIHTAIDEWEVTIVVHEIYRIYKWHTQDHTWAPLHTPRLIGAIELACYLRDVPLVGQTAQVAKNFCTDNNLKAWGLYNAGSPHARDSVRHAVYFALFGKTREELCKDQNLPS